PIDQPLSGNAIAPPTLAMNADLLQHRLGDLGVLGVHGVNARLRLPGSGNRIDILTYKVGGVELKAQAGIRNQVEHAIPDSRHNGEILVAGIILPTHREVKLV